MKKEIQLKSIFFTGSVPSLHHSPSESIVLNLIKSSHRIENSSIGAHFLAFHRIRRLICVWCGFGHEPSAPDGAFVPPQIDADDEQRVEHPPLSWVPFSFFRRQYGNGGRLIKMKMPKLPQGKRALRDSISLRCLKGNYGLWTTYLGWVL